MYLSLDLVFQPVLSGLARHSITSPYCVSVKGVLLFHLFQLFIHFRTSTEDKADIATRLIIVMVPDGEIVYSHRLFGGFLIWRHDGVLPITCYWINITLSHIFPRNYKIEQ